MPKPKFPVITGDDEEYPARALCPRCGKRKVWEPHSFAVLKGEVKFDLTFHGAHDNGIGGNRDVYVGVEIVRDRSGEFELYFCSPSCLRTFLNDGVDELEARIKNPSRGRPRGDDDPLAKYRDED